MDKVDIIIDINNGKLSIDDEIFELVLCNFVKYGSNNIGYECVKEGFINPTTIYDKIYILVNYKKQKTLKIQYYYYLLIKLFYNIIINIKSINIKVLKNIEYCRKKYYLFHNSILKYYNYSIDSDFNAEYYHIDNFIFTDKQLKILKLYYKV